MGRGFIQHEPRVEDCWRGIVLLGRNTATYKFALGRALLDLRPKAGQLVTLRELAEPFARHICDHLRSADKQGQSSGSRFLAACRKVLQGELSQEELTETTVRLGFVNVIDAFHIVGQDEVPKRFFVDKRKGRSGIRMTEAFDALVSGQQAENLPGEAEARWRLVETAWELGVSRSLVAVEHDAVTESLFFVDSDRRRRSITGARDALSGYQKGHCFYCFGSFTLQGDAKPDVDHFFPQFLKAHRLGAALDGVWNLVLACPRCNRGVRGKSDCIPSLKLLERLSTRNEFLISSHHPLHETLIAQTGRSEPDRRRFLNACHIEAVATRLHEWNPVEVGEPLF